ncbi:MAG: glycoside hydrolase family 15 protein [Tannerellaceae bacterium]|nr:glycoside hydrolase family 15 protein [Tannerellaceae bacterium]
MQDLSYGVIGNCKTAALVSKRGSIDWLCLPDFDSPSVFSKILDEKKGGSFSFQLNKQYEVVQQYVPYTNILSTQFISPEGSFEVIDFMPRYRIGGDDNYFTPSEIYRYIRYISGRPRFRIRYNPVLNYAREKAVHHPHADFIKTQSSVNESDNFYLYSSFDFEIILASREIVLEKDEYMMLSYNQKLITVDIERVNLEYERTKVYWLNWSNRSRKFIQYNDTISRSLLILKLMSYQHTGAVLAAITTSIPETIGETRNWDYRFCWIRDASMSIETLIKMGHQSAAKRFMKFIKSILHSKLDSFQIMYGINGERELKEETLPHLAGFNHSTQVRIGNAAYTQTQNDSLGYLMDVIYHYYQHFPGTLDEIEEIWEIVKGIVNAVQKDWRQMDHSIWEFRNKEEHFVFSKVMSWVAIDRAVRIAEMVGRKYHKEKWEKEANLIREDIFTHGWNEQIQSFSQAYGSEYVDSSLLLMEYYEFIEAHDPRYVATVKKIKEELYHNGLMYRYKNEDDFGQPSSSFTICNFWMIQALFAIGEESDALKMFHEVLTYSNHLGIYSEDLDFKTKRQLGNFPQAYSHLALINTALLFGEEKTTSRFIRP